MHSSWVEYNIIINWFFPRAYDLSSLRLLASLTVSGLLHELESTPETDWLLSSYLCYSCASMSRML